LRKKKGNIQKFTLAPLDEININRFVADTLLCSIEIAAPLAKLVYQKTKGNPFFTTQFLKELHADRWIVFDTEARYWQCDFARVRQLALTDDVVQFMARRLHKLPLATQEVLKLAACIGNQFDLATLAVACEETQEQVAADLWPALQEDFIIPESQTYKFFQGEDSEVSDLETVIVGYRFLHDRVQQAAYSLIPDGAKQQVHLKLGRLLWQSIAPEDLDDRLFALVNPLNLGAALITDVRERIQLAKLNLKAGCKAKAATAYDTAIEYLETGCNLLPSDAWQHHYDLTLQLYEKAVEVEYLLGNLDKAKALSEVVLKEARSLLDKVKIYELKVQFFYRPKPND
jgi:predicted ATPase